MNPFLVAPTEFDYESRVMLGISLLFEFWAPGTTLNDGNESVENDQSFQKPPP